MPLTRLEPTQEVQYKDVFRTFQFNYRITNDLKAGETSDEYVLPVSQCAQGKLKQVRVVCLSPDFDISIRKKSSITVPNIHQIYKYESAGLEHDDPEVNIYYKNQDSADGLEFLYLVITNNGPGVSGDIYIELLIYRM